MASGLPAAARWARIRSSTASSLHGWWTSHNVDEPLVEVGRRRLVGHRLDDTYDVAVSRAVRGLTVWLTGLPGSGKTTSASYLLEELASRGIFASSLDGDVMRAGISADLGFSKEDRAENVRRAGEIALLLAAQGAVVVVSLVSPARSSRDSVRKRHAERGVPFLEVHVAAPLETCELRDPKSLYLRARQGSVANMTGVDDPYEPPLRPEVVLGTDLKPLEETGPQLLGAVLEMLNEGLASSS